MMKYFYIVGCPRSGTTMLQQALNRHSQIAIPPETAFFSFLLSSWRIQQEHLRRLNADLGINLIPPATRIRRPFEARSYYEELVRLYVKRLGKPGITHFGDKTPEHLSHLHRIGCLFPDSKVVLIFRDGRDVAASLRRLPWTTRDLYVNFALWLYCYRLQRVAQRSMKLPLTCVRYEDLVNNPEAELRRILAFLGLPYEAQVVDGSGNTDGVPPWEYPWKSHAFEAITSSRIGLWRSELSRDQVAVLEGWGGGLLRELGYELVTDGGARLPWFFRSRVAWRSLLWLARRPRYAQARELWLEKSVVSSHSYTFSQSQHGNVHQDSDAREVLPSAVLGPARDTGGDLPSRGSRLGTTPAAHDIVHPVDGVVCGPQSTPGKDDPGCQGEKQ
jgi:hypothetical protein